MNAPNSPTDSDPFQEPLAPIPSAPEEGAEAAGERMPEAVEASIPALEPEQILPAEDDCEELAVAAAEVELTVPEEPPAPRWKFWKRPNKRDRQIETLRQGASEMVGLMRSIRNHLESERGDREGLRRTLSPLPVAVESLRSMSEQHADAGRVLGELRTTMEQRAESEEALVHSLTRIGDTMANVDETFSHMGRTLSGIDHSNQRSVETMQQLGQRVEDSDRFMNETFARLRDAEREFTDHVSRASRRSNFGMMALCCILLLSVVAVGFMFKENRELLATVQQNGALVVHVPERVPVERVTILEDLKQVDDGIGEPEREIVDLLPEEKRKPSDQKVVPVKAGERPLLSVNELPERK